MHAPPPASRVPPLPQDHRRADTAQSRPASHRRQLRHPQDPRGQPLKQHSRFHLHFTPTSGSWLNMVERFFAEITRKRIRRSVFKSVTDLEIAIHHYLAEHNDHPKPFVWNAKAADILAKVRRGKQALESEH